MNPPPQPRWQKPVGMLLILAIIVIWCVGITSLSPSRISSRVIIVGSRGGFIMSDDAVVEDEQLVLTLRRDMA